MKKYICLILISLFCISFVSYAQKGRRIGESNDGDYSILTTWKGLNDQICTNLDILFNLVDSHNGLSKDTFGRWRSECDEIERIYRLMINYKGDRKLGFKTNNWVDLNKQINNCLKKVTSIDSETVKNWNSACSDFEKDFKIKMNECNEIFESQSSREESNDYNKPDNRRQQHSASTPTPNPGNKTSKGYSFGNLENIPYSNNGSSLKNNSTMLDAFYFCINFPLNVKFHKEGVDYAYKTAKSMLKEKHITDQSYIDGWNAYEPLLKNYEKFNNDVIDYISKQTKELEELNWEVKPEFISYKKGYLKKELSYGKFYKQETSIRYLDYVLDKYFSILEDAAMGKRTLNEKLFDFFIKNELEPTSFN